MMSIQEPSNGRNRGAYGAALALAIEIAKPFTEANPFWAKRMSARVRWYSKQSGYVVQVGYTDPNTGGFTTVVGHFSR